MQHIALVPQVAGCTAGMAGAAPCFDCLWLPADRAGGRGGRPRGPRAVPGAQKCSTLLYLIQVQITSCRLCWRKSWRWRRTTRRASRSSWSARWRPRRGAPSAALRPPPPPRCRSCAFGCGNTLRLAQGLKIHLRHDALPSAPAMMPLVRQLVPQKLLRWSCCASPIELHRVAPKPLAAARLGHGAWQASLEIPLLRLSQ